MFSKWSIVLKYTIKLELTNTLHSCCCLLCPCCTLGRIVGIYSVWIVFCIGVVGVSKITAVGVFYIAWLGVALKSHGSA
jgi:hypothetical protein